MSARISYRLPYHDLGFGSLISVCEPWIPAFQLVNADGKG